jgi:hypothetical protein
MGGLSRRAYILNKIRQEEAKPILVLDAGAMLFPQPFIGSSQFLAKTVQAEGLIKAISQMGYDAFGLAPQDLSAGTNFLLKQPTNVQLPWLSMNLTHKDGQELLFAPYIIKTVGDLSIGILGLTGYQKTESTKDHLIDYQTTGWEESLESSLAMIKNQTNMIILLSSLPEQTNRKITEKFSDIHLIIQSGQSTHNKKPQVFNNTIITQIDSRGKHIGRLDIDWKTSRTWEQSATAKIKPTKDQLDRTNWQIGRLEKRIAPGKIKQNKQYTQLLLDKNRLTTELKELESHNLSNQEQLSTYKGSFIGLPVSLQEDPEIRKIVIQTKLAVNQTNKSVLATTQGLKTQENLQAFSNMAGWKACQSCHKQQTTFWQQTAHSKAWETLAEVKQQFNPECLICHVTLPTYDQETVIKQNLLAGLKEEFKTIGCETCHGPAKDHTQQPDKHLPVKPNEQVCLTCHTPDRDDNFIYSEKLNKIRCPDSGH